MPAYEYKCEDCGLRKVEHRSVNLRDDAPMCGYRRMKRVYSAVPAVFKGEGWASKDGKR